ncbi:hypothetical protein BHQ17_26480 [Mycolicibacterium holsaticum]|uniref:Uncharacterized protein n=1 Tax=Mycolicibacterium holsaticum TaxID=152142 RepID=A0A1E3R463_9MYCO|nr:hypothetical protein BHQ17_26480 [Mycolicibacterium holsaticum]
MRVAPLQELAEVGAVDVVHRDPQLVVVFTPVMDADDVRVAQPGSQIGLADESFAEGLVLGEFRTQDLKCLFAWKPWVLN